MRPRTFHGELRRLWYAGVTLKQIAVHLHCSESNIKYHVRRQGLPLRGKALKPPKEKVRTCLCCRRPFPSEHAFNRICYPCKQRVEFSPGALA